MKKLISWVFIVLILLNVMGYYGIFAGLQYSNAREMMQQFDAGTYNKQEAQTLKIPFPAVQSSETFERVDGDFERDGEIYRLIKQRLYRDTFHIVYIKDRTGTALNHVLENCVKTFSENTSEEDGQAMVLPVFIREYLTRPFSIQRLSPGFEQIVQKQSHPKVLIDSFTSSIIHPPERIA